MGPDAPIQRSSSVHAVEPKAAVRRVIRRTLSRAAEIFAATSTGLTSTVGERGLLIRVLVWQVVAYRVGISCLTFAPTCRRRS